MIYILYDGHDIPGSTTNPIKSFFFVCVSFLLLFQSHPIQLWWRSTRRNTVQYFVNDRMLNKTAKYALCDRTLVSLLYHRRPFTTNSETNVSASFSGPFQHHEYILSNFLIQITHKRLHRM